LNSPHVLPSFLPCDSFPNLLLPSWLWSSSVVQNLLCDTVCADPRTVRILMPVWDSWRRSFLCLRKGRQWLCLVQMLCSTTSDWIAGNQKSWPMAGACVWQWRCLGKALTKESDAITASLSAQLRSVPSSSWRRRASSPESRDVSAGPS
jgi:hypothetical protein